MDHNEILGAIAAAIGIGAMVPYIFSTIKGRTSPHVFSWTLWGFFNFVAGVAQVMGGGGPGAWVNFASALTSWTGAILGYLKTGKRDITRSDCYAAGAAVVSIVPWALTSNPLWSMVLITIIDMFAFYPTFRKGWQKPYDDMATIYALSALKHALGLMALTSVTVTTALFPASLVVTNALFVMMLLFRRHWRL